MYTGGVINDLLLFRYDLYANKSETQQSLSIIREDFCVMVQEFTQKA